MSKLISLGFLILDISNIEIYEFQYDYIKDKNADNAKLSYIATDIFLKHEKTIDFSRDMKKVSKKDLKYMITRLIDMLYWEKMMKDEMGGLITQDFCRFTSYIFIHKE